YRQTLSSASGLSRTSGLRNRTSGAPPLPAPWLHAAANPRFSSFPTTAMRSRSAARSSAEPSLDALSMTTTLSSPALVERSSARRQSRKSSREFQLTMTTSIAGVKFFCSGLKLSRAMPVRLDSKPHPIQCGVSQRSPPCLVRKIPGDRLLERRLKCRSRLPVKLVHELAAVESIAQIVSGSIGNEGDQLTARSFSRKRTSKVVQQIADHCRYIDVATFIVAADIVAFAHSPAAQKG